MQEPKVLFEVDKHVGTITINRPKQLNAVDLETVTGLRRVLSSASEYPEVRAVLVVGAGEKAFSVGADRAELELGSANPQRAEEFEKLARETLDLLAGLEKPTVCAIRGHALGLGLQLALAATLRVASSDATFGLPEINMGFFPSLGATQRLTRLVGDSNAAGLILTGDVIDAEEAQRINLINRVVPRDELRGVADELARSLAAKSATAIRLALKAMRSGRDMKLAEGLAHEAALARLCVAGPRSHSRDSS